MTHPLGVRLDDLTGRLDEVLAQAARDPLVPAVMAAVHAPRLGLHWRGALRGARGLDGDAVSPGLPFRIASVTKLYTAAAVLRLVEDGRLSLQATVGAAASADLAALLARGGHDPARITLSQLLAHTSGLPDHTHADGYEQGVKSSPARVWTRHEQVQLAMEMGPPVAAPDLRCAYSDTGYVILGEVIEVATGQALGPSVRQLLGFDALALAHTYWEQQERGAQAGKMARQCLGAHDTTGLDASFDLHGGGGLVSTVDDLCRFMSALLQGRVFRQASTLAAALLVPTVDRAAGTSVHSRLAMSLPMGAAAAWGHLGYWGCGVICCPDMDITVAATINQPYPETTELRRELASRLGGLVVNAQLGQSP